MKKNLLLVSMFFITALVGCKSNETPKEVTEEVTEEVTTEEVVVDETPPTNTVEETKVTETKTTVKTTTKKKADNPVLESKEAPSISKTKGGLNEAFKEEAKETPKIEKKKGLNEVINEGK